ncbi:hypothetical protein R4Y45_04175 [Holzapfeliella sp. He02]|uniref:Lipoprotein n=1 Tax=Holzapfeliella saturejae TaxID=3082953 RepID=A0ABU8SGH1_9LACO
MKKISAVIAIVSLLLLMGCSTNNNSQQSNAETTDRILDNLEYLTKDEITIPQKGKITILTHGVSQDDQGKTIYKISYKTDYNDKNSKRSLYLEQNNKGVLKSSITHFDSQFETVILELIDTKAPITFTIRENGEALVKRNYYLDT